MEELMESIRCYGVFSALLARPKGEGYELVSGHRRRLAASKLGLAAVPVLVREMSDDESVILMVDSNLQREHLLPSEKAFAYKMKLEAIRRSAGRPRKVNPRQLVGNFRKCQMLSEKCQGRVAEPFNAISALQTLSHRF